MHSEENRQKPKIWPAPQIAKNINLQFWPNPEVMLSKLRRGIIIKNSNGCNKNSDHEWTFIVILHGHKKKSKLQFQSKCQNIFKNLIAFGSSLTRFVNMNCIWPAMWKIQSGHDSVHRQADKVKPGYPKPTHPHLTFNFFEAVGAGGGVCY